MQIKDVKEKFGRFRILVIGRANAGKTTILKNICNSTENPEIYDDQGNKVWSYLMLLTSKQMVCNQVDHAQIQESREVSDSLTVDPVQLTRPKGGMHNIKDEMVFRSNQDFVFHDSRGFEAGGIDEFQQMKDFVAERAGTTFFKKRIHAIW